MSEINKINLSVGDNTAEDIQRTVMTIVLWGGIISSVALAFVVYSSFNAVTAMLTLAIGVISSLIVWSTGMILVNISDNIRTVKHLLAQGKEGIAISKEHEVNTKKVDPTQLTIEEPIEGDIVYKVGDAVIVKSSGVHSTIKDIQGVDIFLDNGIFGGTFKVCKDDIKPER